jgi:hypothetical protein
MAALLGLTLLTACDEANADPTRNLPAAASGIACQLVEYGIVDEALGIRFDTAGGARQDDTVTCALTQAAGPYPYLTLAVTPTSVSDLIFNATLTPSGSTAVPELGRTGYQAAIAAKDGSGPGVELCWLSPTLRLVVLRYIFPATAAPTDITALTAKLVALAKQIEKSLPT